MPNKDRAKRREYDRKYIRKWRKKNPERAKLIDKKYYKKNKKIIQLRNRKARLKINYGLNIADYDELLTKQRKVCAICGKKETRKDQFGICRLSIDHCHTTGKVRGLLCSKCNNGLARFKDDPKLLVAAANYLMRSNDNAYSDTVGSFPRILSG